MARISPDELAVELTKQLATYTQEVQEAVANSVTALAKEGRAKVKSNSPKRTGEYAKGWAVSNENKKGRQTVRIYNKTNYQLTHLLENGHVVRNGTGRIGAGKKTSVAGKPHIAPVNDWIQQEVVSAIEEAIKNA